MVKIRDIALTVMAVLVSLVCVLVLYVAVSAGSALSKIGDDADPQPAVSEQFEPDPVNPTGEDCVGEEPPPGC